MGQAKRSAPSGRPSPAKKQRAAPVSSDEELSDQDGSDAAGMDDDEMEVGSSPVAEPILACRQRLSHSVQRALHGGVCMVPSVFCSLLHIHNNDMLLLFSVLVKVI